MFTVTSVVMKTHVPMNNNTGYLPQVHRWIREKPLLVLMLVGGFLRLLAVIYARGYMASDDHFVVIRVVWEWLNGNPLWFNDSTPVARGVLYQYFIFSFMWILKQIGLTDPSTVMFLNRLLHAAWSMSIIPLVYYGLSKWADERAAWYGGMLVSIHFLIPFFAVRNLVEVVSQPFLLGGLLLLERETREDQRRWPLFFAGLLMGLAFTVRIQTAICPIAVFFYLLIVRQWRPLLWFSLGGISILLLQGLVDYLSWGVFLSSVIYSLGYQSTIVHDYVTNPWYTYLLTISGILIPPFSLLLFPWILKSVKRVPVSFWAFALFLIVHSLIPQKQERFILPIFPLLIFLGAVGWSSVSWRDAKWVKWIWNWMWVINVLLIPIGVFNYSQKARIEPLLFLSHEKEIGRVAVVTIDYPTWLAHYYEGQYGLPYTYIFKNDDFQKLQPENRSLSSSSSSPYSHAIILGYHSPEKYRKELEKYLGPLELVEHVTPSLADWVLFKLNPEHNHSKESWVYRVKNYNNGKSFSPGNSAGKAEISADRNEE